MTDFIANIDPSLPLLLVLLALLGFRSKVTARASLHIAAPPRRVFDLIDLRDGDHQKWHRADAAVRLIDPTTHTFRIRYSTAQQVSEADFRVVERDAPRLLVIDRAGMEGRSSNNELLRIVAEISPEGQGSRLRLAYYWGPRPLVAQILARADLYGGVFRLKGVAETGEPDLVSDNLISAGVALATGLLTLAGFGLWLGWLIAVLILVALLVHEFGHLLAFRLIGQPWGRIVFLPFLGALAMPRLPYRRASESVFSALMGPGFSVVIPLLAALAVYNGAATGPWLVQLGLVAGALNLFNLLPVEPLDGGVAMRSILGRIFGRFGRMAMVGLGLLLCGLGFELGQPIIVVFGGITVLANLQQRRIDAGLAPLTAAELVLSLLGFVLVTVGHGLGFAYLMQHR